MQRATLDGCFKRNGNSRESLPHIGHAGYSRFVAVLAVISLQTHLLCIVTVSTAAGFAFVTLLSHYPFGDPPNPLVSARRWHTSQEHVLHSLPSDLPTTTPQHTFVPHERTRVRSYPGS